MGSFLAHTRVYPVSLLGERAQPFPDGRRTEKIEWIDDDNRGISFFYLFFASFFSFFFLRGEEEEGRQGREGSLSGMSGIPLIHIFT